MALPEISSMRKTRLQISSEETVVRKNKIALCLLLFESGLFENKKAKISTPEKTEELYFPLFLSPSTAKNPGHYLWDNSKKTLKAGGRRTGPGSPDRWVTQWRPLSVFFSFHTSQTWNGNPEMPTCEDKRIKKKEPQLKAVSH